MNVITCTTYYVLLSVAMFYGTPVDEPPVTVVEIEVCQEIRYTPFEPDRGRPEISFPDLLQVRNEL